MKSDSEFVVGNLLKLQFLLLHLDGCQDYSSKDEPFSKHTTGGI